MLSERFSDGSAGSACTVIVEPRPSTFFTSVAETAKVRVVPPGGCLLAPDGQRQLVVPVLAFVATIVSVVIFVVAFVAVAVIIPRARCLAAPPSTTTTTTTSASATTATPAAFPATPSQ